ncbi:MAG: HAD family hydrolase [Chloroflexi bacterium]|jgi:HAD superfamily hydrolase (TIGR01549 family)|nr:HAD family hydrolase [Chloroflexota bacterium]
MPLDLARIKAICFDVDGTLRETDDQYVQALARLFRRGSFLFPGRDPQHLARWFVMRTEDLGTFLFGLPDRFHLDDKMHRVVSFLRRKRRPRTAADYPLVPGVTEMLSRLAARYPLAVISARDEHTTMDFLNHTGLMPFFHCVATAQTCRYTKPYPDPIHWAASKMGVSAAECLMVGDTTVDIRAAKAAGAQAVGVLCGFGEEAELLRSGADLILPVTTDLTGVLLECPAE